MLDILLSNMSRNVLGMIIMLAAVKVSASVRLVVGDDANLNEMPERTRSIMGLRD